jgi:hypothetical protein
MPRFIQRCLTRALLVLPLALFATPAFAQLSTVTPSHDIFRIPGVGVNRYYAAYDGVDQVYMAVFDGIPGRAVFVNKTGTVIFGPIDISDVNEDPTCAPTCMVGGMRAAFGGPSGRTRFLVSYTLFQPGSTPNNPKRVRIVNWNGGSPTVGAPLTITNLRGDATDSDQAETLWTGQQFIVSYRRSTGTPLPICLVAGVDIDGNMTGGGALTDGISDAMVNPGIACDPASGTCLADGFAWGVPFGPPWGATWARRFNSTSFATIGDSFYLTDVSHNLMEDQRVAFNKKTGQFLAAWVRTRSYIDTRVVGLDGTMNVYDQSKSIGPSLGQIAVSYNDGTQTTLLTFKDNKDAWAVELNDQGYVANISASVPVTIPALEAAGGDYYSATLYPYPVANDADGQWLVGYASMSKAGRAAVVGSTPASLGVTGVSPASGPISVATTVTITGRRFLANPTVTVGGTPATAVTLIDATHIQATVPPNPTAGPVSVTVTNTDAQSATLASGYTYFVPVALTLSFAGSGTVTGSGISCSGNCTVQMQVNVPATLTATPAAGWTFVGWVGDADCADGRLAMSGPTSCTAKFLLLGSIDIDGNGKADLVWRDSVTGVNTIWYQDGATTTGTATIQTITDQTWQIAGVGDLDGDAKADFVWRNRQSGATTVWFMDAATMLGWGYIDTIPDSNWQIATLADLNGDGRMDIIWRNIATGANTVWFMNGPTRVGWSYLQTVSDIRWQIVGSGDFNGDVKADLVLWNASTGQAVVTFMNGTTPTGQAVLGAKPDTNWQLAMVSDVNGDGKVDLVWRNYATGANEVWFTDGTTCTSTAALDPAPVTTALLHKLRALVPNDFNGDGKQDLIWRNSLTGLATVWYMNGPTMAGWGYLATIEDPNWQMAAVADLNGDTKPDLVWRNKVTGDATVWFMDGATMTDWTYLDRVSDPNWEIATAVDLNGDGRADLVWRNKVTGMETAWFMDGARMTGWSYLETHAPVEWHIVAAGDLTGDGKPDLIWWNSSTGQAMVWPMDGTTRNGSAVFDGPNDPNWQIATCGDFNGDGKLDIVWRNYTTGANVIWYMDGTTSTGTAAFDSVPFPEWAIIHRR